MDFGTPKAPRCRVCGIPIIFHSRLRLQESRRLAMQAGSRVLGNLQRRAVPFKPFVRPFGPPDKGGTRTNVESRS